MKTHNVLTFIHYFFTSIDSEGQARAKALSNMIKQKRKEKAGKWAVPLPKVKAVGDNEVMKVMRTGKRQSTFHGLGNTSGRLVVAHFVLISSRAAARQPLSNTPLSHRESLEASHHKTHVCRRGVHPQAA